MSVSQALSTSPARIFLSYKRNVEPDQTLAHELVAGLVRAGHAVFIDQRLALGQAWARESKRTFATADFLIVLLTAESSRSEMVRGEIELARQHAATHATPHILPVRIQFDGPLPYPLNAYLDAIQYATWKGPQETPRLLQELLAAMAHGIATAPRARPRRRSATPTCRRRTRRRCPSPAARSTSRIPGICPGLRMRRRWPSSASRGRR